MMCVNDARGLTHLSSQRKVVATGPSKICSAGPPGGRWPAIVTRLAVTALPTRGGGGAVALKSHRRHFGEGRGVRADLGTRAGGAAPR